MFAHGNPVLHSKSVAPFSSRFDISVLEMLGIGSLAEHAADCRSSSSRFTADAPMHRCTAVCGRVI